MKKVIPRSEITQDIYREVLHKEYHHDHKIVVDENERLFWAVDPEIMKHYPLRDLNTIVSILYSKGYTKNSEVYRKIYRGIGYSLYGYWEVFYWDWNNESAFSYKPNKGSLERANAEIEEIFEYIRRIGSKK